MMILVDTNIHIVGVQAGHPQRQIVDDCLFELTCRGHELVIVPQIIYEFWCVATSPEPPVGKGLGASVGTTISLLMDLQNNFTMFQDSQGLMAEWYRLASTYGIIGRQAYDARIAASMRLHNISHILTFNGPDFAVFPGITILDPVNVTAVSQP